MGIRCRGRLRSVEDSTPTVLTAEITLRVLRQGGYRCIDEGMPAPLPCMKSLASARLDATGRAKLFGCAALARRT